MRLLVLPLLLLTAACATSSPPPPPPPPPAQVEAMPAPSAPPQFPTGQSVPNPNERDFQSYLASLRPVALGQGITAATWDRAMSGVNLNMKTIQLSSGAA